MQLTMNDFENIYAMKFVDFPNCYTTCNNGECCQKRLTNINDRSLMLPLLEDEYKYYKKIGGLDGLNEPKKEEFILKNGKVFRLYYLLCNKQGLCAPQANKPLICRLYPYFPKVNEKGEMLGYLYASIFDVYLDKKTHYCTLVRERDDELKKQLQSAKILLKFPIFIFAFKCVEILQNHLLDYLNQSAFSEQNLAKAILFRLPFKSENFKNEISKAYDEIAKNFGDFLPNFK